MKRTMLILALSLPFAALIVGPAAAQGKIAADTHQLDEFVGSGTCSGKSLDANMKSFHATTGKYSGERVLDGKWVQVRYDEDQGATVKKPYHVIQYIGYDTRGRLIAVTVDNSGSGYATGTSTGWKGGSVSFDESMNGKPASFRDTFTSGPNGMSGHTGRMRDKSGKWTKTDEETCKSA